MISLLNRAPDLSQRTEGSPSPQVVHVNAQDLSGGAARAVQRLHLALEGSGTASSCYVLRKESDDSRVIPLPMQDGLPARLVRFWNKERFKRGLRRYQGTRPDGYEQFRDDRVEWGSSVVKHLPPADIVHLHWIAGFVDYRRFLPAAARRTPLVWTLHEMSAFTGGCPFDFGCGRYTDSCGRCPQLGSSQERDLSRRVWQRKNAAFGRLPESRLCLVTPSQWLYEAVRRSSLLSRFPATVIPNGIDVSVFRPAADRAAVRTALGIPQQAKVVLFVAEYPGTRRKGFSYLERALSGLRDHPELFLLSVGKGEPKSRLPFRHLHLGAISNDRLLASVYSAADLFVLPSLEDNLPNTGVESLACGTPVIGFATGGVPEIVRDGQTGRLAPVGDADALGRSIGELLADTELRQRMGRVCRETAEREFSSALMAERYVRLYRALLGPQARWPASGPATPSIPAAASS